MSVGTCTFLSFELSFGEDGHGEQGQQHAEGGEQDDDVAGLGGGTLCRRGGGG